MSAILIPGVKLKREVSSMSAILIPGVSLNVK